MVEEASEGGGRGMGCAFRLSALVVGKDRGPNPIGGVSLFMCLGMRDERVQGLVAGNKDPSPYAPC